MFKKFSILIFLLSLQAAKNNLCAQVILRGTVYDSTGLNPLPSVSVLSGTGVGVISDSMGHYAIEVLNTDSVWFSYLNKSTKKFAVNKIETPGSFNISINTTFITLPVVTTQRRNYREDSIQNRIEYEEFFNYDKPRLANLVEGIDLYNLDKSVELFRFRYKRNRLSFQSRLINEEKDKFIGNRFSKNLIRKLTPLTEDSVINIFIKQYQPAYTFAASAPDYRFHQYITESYLRFERGLPASQKWRSGIFD